MKNVTSDGTSPLSVSVVIPLYNKQATIGRALASIEAQQGIDCEIIVVDDGSTDNSADLVVGHPSVRLIRQTNQGPGAARNRGVAEAAAPLVAFLDADDEWRPDHLETALQALAENPECLAYACGYDSGAFQQQRPNKVAILCAAAGPSLVDRDTDGPDVKRMVDALHSSCVVVRKAVFERLGGFYATDRCLYGEDSYLWIQVLFAGPIYWDPADRVVFHVEDSALGFAQQRRTIARPISLHPDALVNGCPPERREALGRGIRTFVDMDLHKLVDSGHMKRAWALRRLHGLARPRLLAADLSAMCRNFFRRSR